MATAAPETRFTRSGEVDLAYQVVGDGPLDIVVMIGWVSHLEVLWELPEVRHFLERLAAMGRVIIFDKRGTGLSDRSPIGSLEEMVPDVIAIMDANESEEAVLVGWSDAAAIALMVAAAHPDRVRALVLGEMLATGTPDDDHPWGLDPTVMEALAGSLELGSWGQGVMLSLLAPSLSDDERILSWFRRLERMSATPSIAAGLLRLTLATDVRSLLPTVETPALVLHRRDALLIPAQAMEWLASALPEGRYVGVPGDQITGYLGDVDTLMDEVEDFLIGTRVGGMENRRVLTVFFSDVVGSTEQAARVGDRKFHALIETHFDEARRLLTRYGGVEVDTAGDGLFATFEIPSSAIRCALALCEVSRANGLEIRVGLHSGEVVVNPDDVRGIAVHIGSRVSSLAQPGQVMVSRTVRDLVVGSEISFLPAGTHELKGVPGEWELYTIEA